MTNKVATADSPQFQRRLCFLGNYPPRKTKGTIPIFTQRMERTSHTWSRGITFPTCDDLHIKWRKKTDRPEILAVKITINSLHMHILGMAYVSWSMAW